ncbi:MAG TPA: hypothetical protein VK176_14585 [Phycisphaerales bacterium]|nr:hypothetical protein [Phycisphaerales bacterium]
MPWRHGIASRRGVIVTLVLFIVGCIGWIGYKRRHVISGLFSTEVPQPNLLDEKDYGSFDESFPRRRTSEVHAAWLTSAKVNGILRVSTFAPSQNLHRTNCFDFERPDGAGPSRCYVATWRQVDQNILPDQLSGPQWWSICSHGSFTGEPAQGVILYPSIVRAAPNRGLLSPPSLTEHSINMAFRRVLPHGPTDIDGAEKQHLISFLDKCRRCLKKGDILELVACNLGDRHPGGSPNKIIPRLARFLPGVRIVVHAGTVRWSGTDGAVKSEECLEYVWYVSE